MFTLYRKVDVDHQIVVSAQIGDPDYESKGYSSLDILVSQIERPHKF